MYYKVKVTCQVLHVSTALAMMTQDCVSAVANVDDYGGSARLLAATTLRNILGTKTLHEILSDREEISGAMQVRGGKIFNYRKNI